MTPTPLTADAGFMGDTGPADFRRDQWGRPSILQPDGTRKGYTRCSSAAKTIEDTYNLEKWARRNIAYGMAYDASLVARVIAIGGDPATWDKAAKDEVNRILEAADAVAKAHKSADIGTAVHHLTHRLDRGEDVVGGPYQADLDAYRYTTRNSALLCFPEYTECRMVNDLLQMAGTCDRILQCGADLYRVADIKTGQSIEFGGLGWAAQLAAYAGGVLYDTASDERLATPPIDQTVGYIIHLPAGQGRCDIYEVDLVAGHRAAELANEIRAIRTAAKKWIVPSKNADAGTPGRQARGSAGASLPSHAVIGGPLADSSSAESDDREASEAVAAVSTPAGSHSSSAEEPTNQIRRQALRRRYQAMSEDEQLAFCDLHVDPDDLDAVEAALEQVDRFNHVTAEPPPPKIHEYAAGDEVVYKGKTYRVQVDNGSSVYLPDLPDHLSFRSTDPKAGQWGRPPLYERWVPKKDVKPVPPVAPDEGYPVGPRDVADLERRFDKLGIGAQLWTGALVAQGNKAFPFRIRERATVRRYHLYRGILGLAELMGDER